MEMRSLFYKINIGGRSHFLNGEAIAFYDVNIGGRSRFLSGGAIAFLCGEYWRAIAFLEWRSDRVCWMEERS
ncbi:MAG: hypothetical protein AAGD25_22605 [Cyanobacteria bacterium P01_F01_bin.150]